MILCKECGKRFEFSFFESDIECLYCDTIIAFEELKKINRVRRLLRIIYAIIGGVFVSIVVLLSHVIPWPLWPFAALFFLTFIFLLDKFAFRPMACRIIAKIYENYDVEQEPPLDKSVL